MAVKVHKDGRKTVTISLGDDGTGNYPRKTKTFKAKTPKREIDEWETKVRAEFLEGTLQLQNHATVDAIIEKWKETKEWTPKTLRDNEGHIRRYVTPVIGKKRIQDVKATDIIDVFSPLKDKSENTIRILYTLVNDAFNFAVETGVIQKNLVKSVKKRIPKGRAAADPVVMRPEEVRAFLSKESKWKVLYAFLVTTGLRIGEALALKWENVKDGKVEVLDTLDDISSGFLLADRTKTANSVRTVYLTPEVVSMLEGLERKTEFVFSGKGVNYYQQISEEFRSLAPEGMTLHDLRHTACTLMLAAGISPKVVSGMLGHFSVAFTLDTYAHLIPEMYEDVPAKISSAVFAAGK